MHALRPTLLVLLVSLVISACGFRLAGFYEVPEALRQVNLVIPEEQPSNIRPHLNSLLAINGIEVSEHAGYNLEILSERVRRRTASLSVSADTVEYELIGTVRFSVSDNAGNLLIDDREVRAERFYNNDDNTTARDALESQIRQSLQEQLAQQVVRQYLSIKQTP